MLCNVTEVKIIARLKNTSVISSDKGHSKDVIWKILLRR